MTSVEWIELRDLNTPAAFVELFWRIGSLTCHADHDVEAGRSDRTSPLVHDGECDDQAGCGGRARGMASETSVDVGSRRSEGFRARRGVSCGVAFRGMLVLALLFTSTALAQPQDASPPQRPPRVRAEPPTAGSGYPPAIIRRVVQRHARALRACRELAEREPSHRGRPLAFTIDSEGRVTSVEVDEATAGGSAAAECLRREIRTWRFPRPPGGGSIRVSYPLR